MINRKQNKPLQVTRRQFLGQASCAALGTTGLFSTLLNLRLTRAVAAADLPPGDDYKALVCVFQAGGNDSYNMLIPTMNEEFRAYSNIRGEIALEKEFDPQRKEKSGIETLKGLDLEDYEINGRTFGVHPALPEIGELFSKGHLAFLANTGTLIEPIRTVDEYETNRVPRALFSHNDQIMQWQTCVLDKRSDTGWAGHMADILMDVNTNPAVSMNISLSGNNIWQTGAGTTPYSITPNGSVSLLNDNVGTVAGLRRALVGSKDADDNSLAGEKYRNLFEKSYLAEFHRSVDQDSAFSEAFDGVDQNVLNKINDAFSQSQTPLGEKLKGVAQTIAARNNLATKMRRQLFFVVMGGWDHHQELLVTQYDMLKEVDSALSAFWTALEALQVENDVVTFTASDFGRTLRSNGRGTDHAWGGNHIIMGGPVQGAHIYGKYPDMRALDHLDVGSGQGRLIPTRSVDEYMAELALWFGVPPCNLGDLFPNLENFYTLGSEAPPIGFLNLNPETEVCNLQ